ncbi:bifunctional hydroxymethylpyrimidine kinase/phosphomethylpyrimidine kinase [Bathymodiolus septemdierum thioautotrophic gill symbiont]|uniref:hydroxymethylpyrimidine kinase n=1 Tax=endosymbiont of Bathymodiolus septemdierum str. Myojin knoll TaxID=1303921 RepID=A0A0P0UQL4_9GAMM|nr:hydroxymethylpyrimidine/phosphomethylpyrimidine kinase [Bathymodiolus septemdierum thioautotrophic gill symbiont]BAS67200.1 hydroxymethylpyrimidine/phosphomethylpyrimidine kinase [endosymbiont of Bathymodiolus septemdierum str. Myojin knoll]
MNESVLVLSGLDPCGGAGISADIETIHQFGLTALPIITTLTVQNTQSVTDIQAVDTVFIAKQFYHLQIDIDIQIVKIGLLSSVSQIYEIAKLLKDKALKIVLDPIVKSSTEDTLLKEQAIVILKEYLLPLVYILTPNSAELSALSAGNSEQEKVASLPCEWILVTTTDVSDSEIEHRLYQYGKLKKRYAYKKLLGDYHGSGCTLSSAIAALIAQDLSVISACQKALDYTYQTLLTAKNIGKMQKHPNRQKSL